MYNLCDQVHCISIYRQYILNFITIKHFKIKFNNDNTMPICDYESIFRYIRVRIVYFVYVYLKLSVLSQAMNA